MERIALRNIIATAGDVNSLGLEASGYTGAQIYGDTLGLGASGATGVSSAGSSYGVYGSTPVGAGSGVYGVSGTASGAPGHEYNGAVSGGHKLGLRRGQWLRSGSAGYRKQQLCNRRSQQWRLRDHLWQRGGCFRRPGNIRRVRRSCLRVFRLRRGIEALSTSGDGVYGKTGSSGAYGVYGVGTGASTTGTGTSFAGYGAPSGRHQPVL